MAHSGVKNSGGKLVPRSDLRVGTTPEGVIDRKDKINLNSLFRVGTWNVRTLRKSGKLENLKMEMENCNLKIIGLSEVRWEGLGEIVSGDFTMYYSGGEKAERGVAVMLRNEVAKSVVNVQCISDRLMFVKLSALPVDILIIQVYMPTSDHPDEEVERMYDAIEDILFQEGKGNIQVIVMGDWNSVVGKGKIGKTVGPHGHGRQNDRGRMLVEFCQRNDLIVTNTWFQRHVRRLYTWTKPDGQRYQIDYILVRQRYRNSVKNAGTLNGADIDSDHNLLVADIETKLKRVKRKVVRKVKWNLEKLKEDRAEVTAMMEQKFDRLKDNTEVTWEAVKEVLIDTLENDVGKIDVQPKKPWITQEMLEKMRERRKYKNRDEVEYRRLNNALRRETDEARKKYIEEMCDEIMELERLGRYDLMYQKMKGLEWKDRTGGSKFGIENSAGQFISDQNEMLAIWEEYIEKLYDREHRPDDIEIEDESEVDEDEKGPSILQCEVEKAIKDMKRGKATGDDNIPADILKILGDLGMKNLTKMINHIYETGEWPEDFLDVTMIPLKKKPQARKCGDHRTISLISHVGKVIARILNRRMESKIEAVMGEDQFGFRKGRGTRDAIGMMRIITERVLDEKETLYVAFIDWQKAFDRVNWEMLLKMLKIIGVNWRDRRLIKNLYLGQSVKVRLNNGETKKVKIGRGVRQGCCISPILFNLYGEMLIGEALEGLGTFKIGGRVIKNVKFADDLDLIARSQEELQEMMNRLVDTGRRYDMEINGDKCKVMLISREEGRVRIVVDGQELEQVDYFKYLGSILTRDGECTKEIRARIAQAKVAFNRKRTLMTGNLDLKLRKKLVKCYVWSVALYGAETWTLRKKERNYLEAFEMWCWRRIEKIKWTDRVTNEEVLRRVGEERTIIKTIRQRKANWLGHVLRRNCLLHDVIEGRLETEDTRRAGRRKIQILDDLREKRKYWELKEEAEDRNRWRDHFSIRAKA